MSTAFTTLISGAGQLGSRYLQGLAKSHIPLRIYVQDIHEESLVRAEQRWDEVLGPKTHHDVSFHISFEPLPRHLDIAIVATTADVRPQVVWEIANHAAVRFWVLEKVLAQSESGLDEIVSHVGAGSSGFVNLWQRISPWHRQIKSQLGLNHPMTLKVGGGKWGLACNSVHFLDLLAWWTDEVLQEVYTDRLNPYWFEGKRRGSWEVLGTLEALFSGGSKAILSTGEDEEAYYYIEVGDGRKSWRILVEEGIASCSDGTVIPGRYPYQSEMSAGLVESILENGRCDLPTLAEAVAMHRVFIRSLQEHWKRVVNPAATFVPIT